MYILMDTESYHIKQELNIDFVKPIMTVASFLEDKGKTFELILLMVDSTTCSSYRCYSRKNIHHRNIAYARGSFTSNCHTQYRQ